MTPRQQRRVAARAAVRPAPAPATDRLDDEWRRWTAENLLLGTPAETIVARLIAKGAPRAMAEREVALASASPYFRGAAVLAERLAKREWVLACRAKLEAMEGGIDLARRPAPDPESFFRDYYAAHRPGVFGGMIDDWPAYQRWSLDNFEARLGDPLVEVQAGRESNAAYEIRSTDHKRMVALKTLLAELRADPTTNDFYITANNGAHNRTVLSPLWDDVGAIPGILAPEAGRDGFLWMGPRGTVTPWHHDLTNNLLVQVRGRKRVRLVSSAETPRMRNMLHCYSGFATPDLDEASEAERPQVLTCVLEPGDALFIPVGWWHHVEGLDMTIGLSFTNFARDNDFNSFYRTTGQV